MLDKGIWILSYIQWGVIRPQSTNMARLVSTMGCFSVWGKNRKDHLCPTIKDVQCSADTFLSINVIIFIDSLHIKFMAVSMMRHSTMWCEHT